MNPHAINDLATELRYYVKEIVHQRRLRARFPHHFPVAVGHVAGHGLDPAALLLGEFVVEAHEHGPCSVPAYPDYAPRVDIQHGGHVAVNLVDRELVHGQETEPIIARSASYLLGEPSLVDILDRVSVEAEVPGHVFEGEDSGKIGHGVIEANGGASVGREELMVLVTDTAPRVAELPHGDEEFGRRPGRWEVAHRVDRCTVNRARGFEAPGEHVDAARVGGKGDPALDGIARGIGRQDLVHWLDAREREEGGHTEGPQVQA